MRQKLPTSFEIETAPLKEDIPRTWPRDRVCRAEGCKTRLSIYNPKAKCAVHAPPPVTLREAFE